jgi:hypothetical protein
MLLAYLAAAAVAAGAAYGAADYEKLPYWRRWDRGAVRVALGLICIAFALAGLAVTALAAHLDWKLQGSGAGRDLTNGVAYGAVTFILLRVEFTGFGLASVSPARTLLKIYLARVDPALTAGANVNVTRRLGDLKPKQLCQVSLDLFLRHVQPDLPVAITDEHLLLLVGLHAQAMHDGDADDTLGAVMVDTARGLLRHRCWLLIVDNLDSTVVLPDDDVPEHWPDA